jgi:5-methylcytosine-specific restriction endonuclease McrA
MAWTTEQKREYARRRYQTHKELIRQQQREWRLKNYKAKRTKEKAYYLKNRAKIIERRKRWRLDNLSREKVKEKILRDRYRASPAARAKLNADFRAWYEKNAPRKREMNSRTYAKNLEYYRAKRREYYATHKADHHANVYLRRAKAKGVTIDTRGVTNLYRWIKTASKVRCTYCKAIVPKGKRHLDHATPLCRGGEHCVKNLVPACAKCNQSKFKSTAAEFRKLLRTKAKR